MSITGKRDSVSATGPSTSVHHMSKPGSGLLDAKNLCQQSQPGRSRTSVPCTCLASQEPRASNFAFLNIWISVPATVGSSNA